MKKNKSTEAKILNGRDFEGLFTQKLVQFVEKMIAWLQPKMRAPKNKDPSNISRQIGTKGWHMLLCLFCMEKMFERPPESKTETNQKPKNTIKKLGEERQNQTKRSLAVLGG